MRNARLSAAASDATRVHKHELDVHSHGEKNYFAYIGGMIGGPGGVIAGLSAQILRLRKARQSGRRIPLGAGRQSPKISIR